ncbi:unnamed protein product [Larinioides sclopetarius]|uniref:Uncharacterized protein n=1 Tax=Larinioides sclopetarius TaxID=280406 RepID=A0AAV1Z9R6_9ARAC
MLCGCRFHSATVTTEDEERLRNFEQATRSSRSPTVDRILEKMRVDQTMKGGWKVDCSTPTTGCRRKVFPKDFLLFMPTVQELPHHVSKLTQKGIASRRTCQKRSSFYYINI